jgi:uncharacterized protein YcbX
MKSKKGTERYNGQGLFEIRKREVEAMNPAAHPAVNAATVAGPSFLVGKWRWAVRGFAASIRQSARRLNAMAALRANTMHNKMPSRSSQENSFLSAQARAALRRANGKANRVWLKRIISNSDRIRAASWIKNFTPATQVQLVHRAHSGFSSGV